MKDMPKKKIRMIEPKVLETELPFMPVAAPTPETPKTPECKIVTNKYEIWIEIVIIGAIIFGFLAFWLW
jgi:hypothetical protein